MWQRHAEKSDKKVVLLVFVPVRQKKVRHPPPSKWQHVSFRACVAITLKKKTKNGVIGSKRQLDYVLVSFRTSVRQKRVEKPPPDNMAIFLVQSHLCGKKDCDRINKNGVMVSLRTYLYGKHNPTNTKKGGVVSLRTCLANINPKKIGGTTSFNWCEHNYLRCH